MRKIASEERITACRARFQALTVLLGDGGCYGVMSTHCRLYLHINNY